MTDICKDVNVSRDIGYVWFRDRKAHGIDVYRRTRKKSKILGRKSRISKTICQFLVNKRNKTCFEPLEIQIKKYNISVKPRTLKTQFRKYTNEGKFYT
jgi:transposase